MEAAGIEPASRDVSVKASTCVAGSFKPSPRLPPNRLGCLQASQERVLIPGVPDSDLERSEIGDQLLGLFGENPQSGLLFFLGSQCEITLCN
jgi:hypothetical protein